MSIEPISPVGSQAVNPPQKSSEDSKNVAPPSKLDGKISVDAPKNGIGNIQMSTENFVVLKAQNGEQDPFANLDYVIEKMQNNVEELGEALEGLVEKIQKLSEMSVGLQILTKTFDAIEKYRSGSETK